MATSPSRAVTEVACRQPSQNAAAAFGARRDITAIRRRSDESRLPRTRARTQGARQKRQAETDGECQHNEACH
jgi:hypothetical protein